MTDYSIYDKAIGKLQPGKGIVYVEPSAEQIASTLQPNIQYHISGRDGAERLDKLESDVNFIRGMLIDICSKCPKMMHEFNGDKKKRKKNDTVECENCGGLLW